MFFREPDFNNDSTSMGKSSKILFRTHSGEKYVEIKVLGKGRVLDQINKQTNNQQPTTNKSKREKRKRGDTEEKDSNNQQPKSINESSSSSFQFVHSFFFFAFG